MRRGDYRVSIPFSFDPVEHVCYEIPSGDWIPSSTQIIELAGIGPSFKKLVERGILDRNHLDRRCWIGREVHDLTDTLDQDGELNPLHVTPDLEGYIASWEGFKRMTGFIPTAWSIRRCEMIAGMRLTGECDVEGSFPGPRQTRISAIVDKKTGSSASDSWGFQVCSYEMLKFASPKIGRLLRVVAHLKADGSPGRAITYGDNSPIDGVHYGDAFLAALHCVDIGIRRGYLSERDVVD
jgi:hypothetical protein